MSSNEVEFDEVVSTNVPPSSNKEDDEVSFSILDRLSKVEERAKSNTHRLDNHDKQFKIQQEQLDVLKQMNSTMSSMAETLGVVKHDVDVLKEDKIGRDAVDNYWTRFWSSTVGKLVYKGLELIIISTVLACIIEKLNLFN